MDSHLCSQDWQWDGEVNVPNRPRKREAASIHLRAGDSSTISYTMPMVATENGYEPSLHVHLDTVTVSSSLNDIRVLTANSCVVSKVHHIQFASLKIFVDSCRSTIATEVE